MGKPEDISQEVWDEAVQWWRRDGCSARTAENYARAILSERERCAKIAEAVEVWKHLPGDFEANQIAAAIRNTGA